MRRTGLVVAFIVVAALLAAGCGSSESGSATTDGALPDESGVVFGRGTVPATVPETFPIPDEAVVGATLIDGNRGITEMILTLPATFASSVSYYEENLPGSGYEITSAGGSQVEWEFVFVGDEADGVVDVKAAGTGVSSVTVRFTQP